MKRKAGFFLTGIMVAGMLAPEVFAQTPAKKLFGSKPLPAAMKAQVHGFYTKGCVAGAIAIPVDGPNWQAMRLSRNRRWGHPELIATIESLSVKAKQDGWNGLLVGDISQPRGGPMLTGHRSHQIGLDADLWFNPMPDRRMSYNERENISAVSVLKKGSFYVDESRWTRAHTMLLYHAASFRNIERVLVHPGVKKKLCDTVKGDRSWLRKIRPTWGHHYHFHLRMACPSGSPDCRKQAATPSKTGCNDGSLDWWFKEGLVPKKPTGKKPKPRRELRVGDLPDACSAVLQAGAPSIASATYRPVQAQGFVAPEIAIPEFSTATVLKGRNIEATGKSVANITGVETNGALSRVPVPTPRPR
ncbi:MAG: penicillin-insensitive murein endopeptidase [Rhizobiaceae bacterium]|nr:penicillin-insensitive murein endopeptidase [Rhizobiaceae bacterium]